MPLLVPLQPVDHCLQGASRFSIAIMMLQDAAYAEAGAQLGNGSALQQDIVLKVRPPHTEEVPQLRAGARWLTYACRPSNVTETVL